MHVLIAKAGYLQEIGQFNGIKRHSVIVLQ